jgi:hypothetical protein
MKRPLIGGKDFKTSIGQGKQAQEGVMEGGQVFLTLKKEDLMCFWEEKEDDECVKKNNSYVEKLLFMKKQNLCKQRAWEEVVCSK